MARIPIYEDRLTPSGFGVTPQARPVEISDAVGRSMQRLGEAGSNMAAVGLRNLRIEEEKLQKKLDDDAVVGVGAQLANATAQWPARVDELARNSSDGGLLKEGEQSVPMTQKLTDEFSAYREKFLSGITNPKARQYAEQHLNSLWAQTYSRSLQTEAKLGVENRLGKVDQATDTYAAEAGKDASQAPRLLKDAQTLIANSGFEEGTRLRAAMAAKKKIIESAITGELMRNPGATRAALLERWGMTEADLTGVPQPGKNTTEPAGVTRNEDGSITLNTDPKLPAGMRNNNPGNIKWVGQSDALGKSKNTDQGDPQAVYATPEEGAAAMYRLALKKFDGGKTTINALIAERNGWTPGNTAAAANIARTMGIKPDEQVNLRDPATLKSFARALVTQEHGAASRAYSDEMLGQVADAVLAGRKPEVRNAGAGRGAPPSAAPAAAAPPVPAYLRELVGQLEPERVPQFVSSAATEINRQSAVYRSQIATTEGDHVTAYMNGQPPPRPLTEAEYVKAYGPIEGPQRYANYQAIGVMGQDISALKLQTPEQIQATVERYRPDPAQPGYELANKRFAAVVQAADSVNRARQEDPMLFAQQNRIGSAAQLNFNDQAAFAQELSRRTGVAQTMQQTYGAPFALLSKAEAQTLNQGFQRMTSQQKLGYLNAIRTTVTDPAAYRAIMQQVAPDSPVTAMAGIILQKQNPMVVPGWMNDTVYKQQDVAAIMLEGEALMNPTKGAKGEDGRPGKTLPMPKEEDIRSQFTNVVGRAFAADPNGANFAYQAVKAYYAGKSARDGDVSGQLDSGRLKEAVNAVVGGVSDINGKGEVVRPWGMSEERFKNGLKASFDQAIQAAGYKGSLLDNWGAYGVQSAGDGKYLLRSGTGYLTDKTGNPIVLDVTERSAASQIPKDSDLYGRGGGGREVSGKVIDLVPPATQVQPKNAAPVTTQPQTK